MADEATAPTPSLDLTTGSLFAFASDGLGGDAFSGFGYAPSYNQMPYGGGYASQGGPEDNAGGVADAADAPLTAPTPADVDAATAALEEMTVSGYPSYPLDPYAALSYPSSYGSPARGVAGGALPSSSVSGGVGDLRQPHRAGGYLDPSSPPATPGGGRGGPTGPRGSWEHPGGMPPPAYPPQVYYPMHPPHPHMGAYPMYGRPPYRDARSDYDPHPRPGYEDASGGYRGEPHRMYPPRGASRGDPSGGPPPRGRPSRGGRGGGGRGHSYHSGGGGGPYGQSGVPSIPIRAEDIVGKVVAMSRDQAGCRLLQQQLNDGNTRIRDLVFTECLPHFPMLMVHPFGNYLAQALVEHCDVAARLQILQAVTQDEDGVPTPRASPPGTARSTESTDVESSSAATAVVVGGDPGAKPPGRAGAKHLSHLVKAALNLHGTRSVQKLVDVCRRPEEFDLIVTSLKPWVVHLATDAHGNHVLQRCLLNLPARHRSFIIEAVQEQCLVVARHRHGCCVLQRCLDAGTEAQKDALTAEIVQHAKLLSCDAFGNYVVQYVLEKGTWEQAKAIMSKLPGNMMHLCCHKFASPVVEACLQIADEHLRTELVRELCAADTIGRLLSDCFGNYVVQRALMVSSEKLGLELVEAIRPHLQAVANTAGGRRIMARIAKKYPDVRL